MKPITSSFIVRLLLGATLLLAAASASADHRRWGHPGRHYGWFPPAPVYVVPPPMIYSAPPPVYLPPPINYMPLQPGISVGIPPFYFNFPLGGYGGWGQPHHHHHGRW